MKRGFTLLELLIVIGILAILAGAMIPMFRFSKIQAQQNKARTDIEAIRSAAMMYNYDTGVWPLVGSNGDTTCLVTNTVAGCPLAAAGWNGPYLPEWGNDPWGNAYVLLNEVAPGTRRWVQSVGPDDASDACADDDLCVVFTR